MTNCCPFAHCFFEDHLEAVKLPCHGSIEVVDEITTEDDWWWVHACTGHMNMWHGGSYKEKTDERV